MTGPIGGTSSGSESGSTRVPVTTEPLPSPPIWNDDGFFEGNWFNDPDKLETAAANLISDAGENGINAGAITNQYMMETLQAILRTMDGCISGVWDPKTLATLEDRMFAFDLGGNWKSLSGSDIAALYNGADQTRSGFAQWYTNGGDKVSSGCVILACGYIVSRPPQSAHVSTLDDLLTGAKLGRGTKGRAIQYIKSGGYEMAVNDFYSMGVTNVRNIPSGLVGQLPDGTFINVRSVSSYGTPTLQIGNIKIRY